MTSLLFRLVYPHRGRMSLLGNVEWWLFRNSRSYKRRYWQQTRGRGRVWS